MRILRGGARAPDHRRLDPSRTGEDGVQCPSAMLRKRRICAVIKVKICNDKPVVIPADSRQYDLRALVDQITRENSHDLIDWGKPVGKESW